MNNYVINDAIRNKKGGKTTIYFLANFPTYITRAHYMFAILGKKPDHIFWKKKLHIYSIIYTKKDNKEVLLYIFKNIIKFIYI